MSFKWILMPVIAALLTAAVPADSHSGSDVAGTVPRILTAVSERDARYLECTFGDAAADAVRFALGTDLAVVCGGDLVHNLLPGEITYDELKAAFREDRPLAVIHVTPKELRVILEAGLSHVTLDETETIDSAASVYDGFPQISGFALSYDTAAPPGERLREVRVNGEQISLDDDTTVYTLTATEFMLSGGYGLPPADGAVASELTLSEAMAMYLNNEMPDYSQTGRRILPMGARNGSVTALYPMGISLVVILIIVLGNGRRFKRLYDFKR